MAYIGATRRLNHAVGRFDNSGMAMDPGPGAEPVPWTPEQKQIIRAAASGFREVLGRREEWDQLRREFTSAWRR